MSPSVVWRGAFGGKSHRIVQTSELRFQFEVSDGLNSMGEHNWKRCGAVTYNAAPGSVEEQREQFAFERLEEIAQKAASGGCA